MAAVGVAWGLYDSLKAASATESGRRRADRRRRPRPCASEPVPPATPRGPATEPARPPARGRPRGAAGGVGRPRRRHAGRRRARRHPPARARGRHRRARRRRTARPRPLSRDRGRRHAPTPSGATCTCWRSRSCAPTRPCRAPSASTWRSWPTRSASTPPAAAALEQQTAAAIDARRHGPPRPDSVDGRSAHGRRTHGAARVRRGGPRTARRSSDARRTAVVHGHRRPPGRDR